MLKKQDKNIMKTEELIGPKGAMGHLQDLLCFIFLDP
jgi:hypothetical protein